MTEKREKKFSIEYRVYNTDGEVEATGTSGNFKSLDEVCDFAATREAEITKAYVHINGRKRAVSKMVLSKALGMPKMENFKTIHDRNDNVLQSTTGKKINRFYDIEIGGTFKKTIKGHRACDADMITIYKKISNSKAECIDQRGYGNTRAIGSIFTFAANKRIEI